MMSQRRALCSVFIVTTLVSLGLTGVVVAADRSDLPVLVEGTHDCGQPMPGFATYTDENGARSFRGRFGTCTFEMSDPIVSGVWRGTLNAQCASPSDAHPGSDCVFWGGEFLDFPDGGWDCTFTGFDDPSGQDWGLVHGICAGYDGLEGMSYLYTRTLEGASSVGEGTSIRGLVYEGPLPGEEWPLPRAE